jgi:hypothetical protein
MPRRIIYRQLPRHTNLKWPRSFSIAAAALFDPWVKQNKMSVQDLPRLGEAALRKLAVR